MTSPEHDPRFTGHVPEGDPADIPERLKWDHQPAPGRGLAFAVIITVVMLVIVIAAVVGFGSP